VSLFEPYRNRLHGEDLPAKLTDLGIRPAVSADVSELSRIEAARDGGDPAEFALRLESTLASTGHGMILVAQHGESLLGLGKVSYFSPAEDAPANVAPQGWYLSGVVVVPEYRGRGIGRSLTRARLDWIAERDRWAFYFANLRNRVSIELHQEFGFVELTRDFTFPGVTFEGGVGALFRTHLARGRYLSGLTGDWTRRPGTAG